MDPHRAQHGRNIVCGVRASLSARLMAERVRVWLKFLLCGARVLCGGAQRTVERSNYAA